MLSASISLLSPSETDQVTVPGLRDELPRVHFDVLGDTEDPGEDVAVWM